MFFVELTNVSPPNPAHTVSGRPRGMTTPWGGAPVNHTYYFSWLGHSCFSQATRLASLGGEYLKGETEKAYKAEHESRVNEGSRLPACFNPVLSRRPRAVRKLRPGRHGHQTLDPSTAPTGTRREELPVLIPLRSVCCHTGPNMRHSSRMQDAMKVGSFLQRRGLLQNFGVRTLNYRIVRRPCSESLQEEGS